jgi:DNA-binding NarL/FixJ family response regulator
MIRVCIVEDQTLVRQGLESLLDLVDDISVVAIAEDGEQAPRVITDCHPDVVLLDMRLPKADGADVLRALARIGSLPPTLILTPFDEDAVLLEGLKAGARGYLLKDVSLVQLTAAIRIVAAGGNLFNPSVTQRVLSGVARYSMSEPGGSVPTEALTPREIEILRLLAGGYSNHEIAQVLKLSEGTIKNHVSNVLGKLLVRDRTRAVLKAIQHGYI